MLASLNAQEARKKNIINELEASVSEHFLENISDPFISSVCRNTEGFPFTSVTASLFVLMRLSNDHLEISLFSFIHNSKRGSGHTHLNQALFFYFQKLLCMKRLLRARERPEQLALSGEPRLRGCSPALVQLTLQIKAPLEAIKPRNAK